MNQQYKKSSTSILLGTFVTVLFLVISRPLHAQVKDNGPTSVIITYRCKPENRAALRVLMETKAAQRFAQWKKNSVFQDCQIFFTSYTAAGVGTFDLMIIVSFFHYTDLSRWKEVERRMPGGLTSEELALAIPDRTSFVYPTCHGETARRDPVKASYVLGLYTSTVDDAVYRQYTEGYVEPQLKGWAAAGVLSAYVMYQCHPYQEDPAETPWTSLLVLEYTDMSALAGSEVIKKKVREELAADFAWKALSDNKTNIRKAKGFVFVDAIVPLSP